MAVSVNCGSFFVSALVTTAVLRGCILRPLIIGNSHIHYKYTCAPPPWPPSCMHATAGPCEIARKLSRRVSRVLLPSGPAPSLHLKEWALTCWSFKQFFASYHRSLLCGYKHSFRCFGKICAVSNKSHLCLWRPRKFHNVSTSTSSTPVRGPLLGLMSCWNGAVPQLPFKTPRLFAVPKNSS